MINGHGNNVYDYTTKIEIDFSSNVYNNPCTSELINHLKEEVDCIRNYPDCNCKNVRGAIAKRLDVDSDNVLMTNGSTEAFYLVAHAYKRAESVMPIPSFSEYEDACKLYGHSLEFVSNNACVGKLELKDKLIWLGNPNNPDGVYYSKPFLISWIKANPNTLFIIDEAYIELCKGGESIANYVNEYSNLIVIKSFTKLYTIPGIRLGYIVANSSVIRKIQEHHVPWAVNSLALKLGEYILNNSTYKNTDTLQILEDAQFLQNEIENMAGMRIVKSPTNFFIVQLIGHRAAKLKEYLLKEYGFLIRDATNFRGLSNEWFRLASQGRENDSKLLIALKNWAKTI